MQPLSHSRPSGHSSGEIPLKTSPSKTETNEKIKKNLGKILDFVHRGAVALTGLLAFSARGLLFNIVTSLIRIPIRLVQSAGPDFHNKMKEYMKKDWNQGIQDSYINLESPKNNELRKKVLAENLCYASYVYKGAFDDAEFSGILPSQMEGIASEKEISIVNNIKTKVKDLGFKEDSNGNFYDTKTGNMFNLVYDTEKKEICVGFWGLGNQDNLDVDKNTKKAIGDASGKAAGFDWIGGTPAASLQAIEIGKAVKEATQGSEMTPVMIGHSHGGGLAQCAAAANGLKGIAFNSRPMGAGMRRYIGQAKIAESAKNMTVFSSRGDWLSGTAAVNALAAIFERVTGIPVPRSIGTGYHLPDLPGEDKLTKHMAFKEEFNRLKERDLKAEFDQLKMNFKME